MAKTTMVARRDITDGTLRRVLPDGGTRAMPRRRPPRSMTESQIEAAALADPDNPPLTPGRLAAMKRVPQARVVRRALGLTQEAFAERFGIPLGTLRDWEQGKCEPDQTARAYLRVIARDPEAVARALRAA